jgi:hypothetical protein
MLFRNPLAGGFRIPGLMVTVSPSMFFDRREVQAALAVCQYTALMRVGGRIRDYAVHSIRQVGLARRPLRIQVMNPGIPAGQLASIPNLRQSTRRALIQRAWEIRNRPPSPPGTPPHTHVPFSHMLGFRRNLLYGYDRVRHVVVVGPAARGDSPTLPGLHEFGGRRLEQLFAWQLRYPRTLPIVRWFPRDQAPYSNQWVPTGVTRRHVYPPRPFMAPALHRAIVRGDLARAFRGTFRHATVTGGFRG